MSESYPLAERINELAALAKQRELTPEEAEERNALRKAYLANFRQNFRQQLDNTVVERDDGTKVPLKDWHEAIKTDATQAFKPEK